MNTNWEVSSKKNEKFFDSNEIITINSYPAISEKEEVNCHITINHFDLLDKKKEESISTNRMEMKKNKYQLY